MASIMSRVSVIAETWKERMSFYSDEEACRDIAALINRPDLLTLRDKFAMAAMNGLISGEEVIVDYSTIAMAAYGIADAMMEARKK